MSLYTYFVIPGFVLLHVLMFLKTNDILGCASNYYKSHKWLKVCLAAVFAFFCVSALLGCFLPESSVKFLLMKISNIWLGFCIYYNMLLLILVIVMAVKKKKGKEMTKNWARAQLLCLLAVSVGVTGYGMMHARDLKVVSYDLAIDKKNEVTDQLKVVVVGDLHMSVNTSPSIVQNCVDKVNEQNADLVFIVGDFFTSTYHGLKNPEIYEQILSSIQSKYGVYGVYGNHDIVEPLLCGFPIIAHMNAFRDPEISGFTEASGVTILEDEVTEVAGIVLAGRRDRVNSGNGAEPRIPAADLLADADTDKPVILLSHEPDDFEACAAAGADLHLAGHTHAGQLFPITLATQFFNENNFGRKDVGNMVSIVTAGVGFYGPPMRVGADADITVINMQFK